MAEDPYSVLGVAKDATEDQIRAAYRTLAKKHHPDLNPGDKAAEERFKAVSAAHDLLSDPERRARYDRGEIDAAGQERPPPRYDRNYRDFAEGRQGSRYGAMDEDDLGDILSGVFGARRGAGGTIQMRGADRRYTLAVSFLDAARGSTQRLALPGGDTLDVRVPPGTETGQVLRLRGKGGPGRGGGPPGDALIEVSVEPHRSFRREGADIHLELPVTVAEAVLGAKVPVPTLSGPVTMTVPAGSDAGTRLRLRGRGIPAHGDRPAGDQHVTLRVVIGPTDDALRDFLRGWAPAQPFDPRRGMEEP